MTRLGVDGTSIELLPEGSLPGSRSPRVRLSDFMERLPDEGLTRSLEDVQAPAELWAGASLAGRPGLWVLFDPPTRLPRDEVVVLSTSAPSSSLLPVEHAADSMASAKSAARKQRFRVVYMGPPVTVVTFA